MGYRGSWSCRTGPGSFGPPEPRCRPSPSSLGVSKASVSGCGRGTSRSWPDHAGLGRGPKALQQRKAAEIEELRVEGASRIGELSDRKFLVAGAALYAGEGAKRDGHVRFANSVPPW